MTKDRLKQSPIYFIFLCIAGIIVAAASAALFTLLIMLVADFFLYTKPPSVTHRIWRAKFFERVNWNVITIFWGVTFFAALISLFGDTLRRWGRKRLDGES